MKTEISKEEIKQKISDVFSKNPSAEEIRKIKKLAMSKNIKLGEYKKEFCKKCYCFFNKENSSIRIKKGFKTVRCNNCSKISRYKLI